MPAIEVSAAVLDWIVRIVNILAFVGAAYAFVYRRRRRLTVQRFFGGKKVTTYFPLRILDGRRAVDEADLSAAQDLERFLGAHGIDVEFEFVDDGAEIDLDRDGLIVICGPKTSPTVRQSMDQDDAIQFEEFEGMWTLVEAKTRTRFRSLRDVEGKNSDIGYLSRAPRRRGRSETFLSIAGVHAQGSAVVVQHLCDYGVIRDLTRQFDDRTFSAVFAGEYAINPFRIRATEQLAVRPRSVGEADPGAFAAREPDKG